MARIRLFVIVTALSLIAAACGGSDQPEGAGTTNGSAGEAATILSDDGTLQLGVPADAVPNGEAITITAVEAPSELRMPGGQTYAYDLEPSGLEFAVPATATVTIPVQGDGVVVGLVALDGGDGALESVPATFTTGDGSVTVEAQVDHFSDLYFWFGGEKIAADDDCSESMALGSTCTAWTDLTGTTGISASFEVAPWAEGYFAKVDDSGDRAVFECVDESGDYRRIATIDFVLEDLGLIGFLVLAGARTVDYRGGTFYDAPILGSCVAADPLYEDPASGMEFPETVSTEDPIGDFIAEEVLIARGFEAVEPDPPSGIDLTGVEVTHEEGGDRTVIVVRFAGSFLPLENDGGRDLTIRPVFLRDGSVLFEANYFSGEAYLSGGPEGASVSFEWLDDRTIRFVVDGHVLEDGDSIRLDVSSYLESGAVQGDSATVEIGS